MNVSRLISVLWLVALGARADVILDNIGDGSALGAGVAHASQDFEPSFDIFDVAVVDDFSVTQDQLRLLGVEAVLGFWGNSQGWDGPIAGYRVEIYSSPTAAALSLTGDVASAFVGWGSVTTPFGGGSGADQRGLLALAVDLVLPAPGLYWVGVIPIMSYDQNGQIGVIDSPLGNQNAKQANPGYGMGFHLRDIQGAAGNSGAYRITATPEAASAACLGALVALGRRHVRRRFSRPAPASAQPHDRRRP